eukprot:Lithocolla_globosa_v1_NODE_5081_length_1307_cov_36.576217.p1 type:complete len:410 gc:universal NODE_5081_length_1307_cov_36.576217:1253-24(-)
MSKTAVVGYANLPNQVHRRSLRQGFTFTLMVVGESGLGKSTFVNTLFSTPIYDLNEDPPLSLDQPTQVQIKTHTTEIEEKGVRLKLNIIDTPGYGDFINNENSWKPILECITERYDNYLDQERRVNRKTMVDNRVHCCLYFISPTGHRLKPLDIEFMKQLHKKVNIIPVIAKADTLTAKESASFKKRILKDLDYHNISIYKITTDAEDDEDTISEANELMSNVPFAVVGSDQEIDVGGKKIKARQYPWGVIEVENEKHCDFVKLRETLIRSHMEDLRETTSENLYESYRTEKLLSSGGGDAPSGGASPFAQFEEEKKKHELKIKKMEQEMNTVFQAKVKEKESKLQQHQDKLTQEHAEQKEQLEKERKQLEEKKRGIEDQTRQQQEAAAAAAASSKDTVKKSKKRSGLF